MTYLIRYGSYIYIFHGVSTSTDFSRFNSTFQRIFESFNKLTDQSKINVKAEKIKIYTVKTNQTLRQALTAAGMPTARLNELALVNGMQLTDQVKAGMLIKTVTK